MPTPDILEKMDPCFMLVLDQIDWSKMPEDFVGPDGCNTPKKCKDYCDSHAAECLTGVVTFTPAPKIERPPEEGILPPKEGIILPPPGVEYMSPEDMIPPFNIKYKPSEGIIIPPPTLPPGEEFIPPEEGYVPAPEGDKPPGEIMPPPPTPPQSSIQLQSFLGSVMKPLSGLFELLSQ